MKAAGTVQALRTALTDTLVEIAETLGGKTSQSEIRLETHQGFSRLDIQVAFYVLEGERVRALCPGAEAKALDVDCAKAALSSRRAAFRPSERQKDVYLPIGMAEDEVLVLSGATLEEADGPIFSLFARQLSSALANARAMEEYRRRNAELAAVAQVARLAAQPLPAAFEAFLAEIFAPLNACAVTLHVPDEQGTGLVLAAHHQLDDATRAALASVPLWEGLAGRAALSSPVKCVRGDESGLLPPEGFESGAAVRLTQGGILLGILQALRKTQEPFDARALELLQTCADLLVATIEQRRLHSESWKQLSETQLLLELARTTAGTLELSHILEVACDFLVKLLNVSNCFILLYDERARTLQGAAASQEHREFVRTVTISLDDPSVAARAARERKPVAIEELAVDPHSRDMPLAVRLREKAVLALPMMSRDTLIGVVMVDDIRGPRRFPTSLIELAEATIGQLSLSVANARLYESLKDSYAELARTRAQMVKRERLVALGELSAIVAHEVRNPLGVIFNAVSALRRQLPAEGDSAMLLDIVREEGDRLNSIVGELLDFARPRAISLQPENLQRVVEDAVDATFVQVGPRSVGIDFRLKIEDGLPPVPMDQRLIRQALVNVLVNAAQAMPQGGQVTVAAQRERRDGKGVVRIDLSDQGGGIPAEISFRIFEPFFTTKAKGTGLGLAVVKRILEDHHGDVEVSSSVGQGTTFTFRLPLSPESGRGEAL